ncbi:hypothetical protein FBULB1_14097 [Fusarium bulbicola]|nr:hypothetical protein FBULB1_14097 [Fusarium bulbicola]
MIIPQRTRIHPQKSTKNATNTVIRDTWQMIARNRGAELAKESHTRQNCPNFTCRGRGAVHNASSPIVWSMDTLADNVTSQTCQGPHAPALCRVHEQKPDKKRNALSVPVATNYNHVVTKTLSTEQQSIMDLIQRHQAPSINAFRNQAFYGQENQQGQFNDGNGGDNGGSTGETDNGGSTENTWGAKAPIYEEW